MKKKCHTFTKQFENEWLIYKIKVVQILSTKNWLTIVWWVIIDVYNQMNKNSYLIISVGLNDEFNKLSSREVVLGETTYKTHHRSIQSINKALYHQTGYVI